MRSWVSAMNSRTLRTLAIFKRAPGIVFVTPCVLLMRPVKTERESSSGANCTLAVGQDGPPTRMRPARRVNIGTPMRERQPEGICILFRKQKDIPGKAAQC